MKAVILVAGVGSRLGRPYPKTLSKLPDGTCILERQINALKKYGVNEIIAVVGFKKEIIMESFPDILYKYNPIYYITNTAKSLLKGIENIDDDVIWLNGDVVFDEKLLEDVVNFKGNLICVNNERCCDEEVKYTLDEEGNVKEISKAITQNIALGEAIGINKISKQSINNFKDYLKVCNDNDYFEKGIEYFIKNGGVFKPLDISNFRCMEIDFKEDWDNMLNVFGYHV